MDDVEYLLYQDKKLVEYEGLCNHCGACCGVLDGDPCEHLKVSKNGFYLCDIYEYRFGSRKTVKGKEILCVPLRNILHKTWWGRSGCGYVAR
jgi:hypothetical protein